MRNDHDQIPEGIRDQGLDFNWNKEKLWALSVPEEEINISEIEWQLDLPFWHHDGNKYSLCPREVLNNMNLYADHRVRVLNADTSHPIDLIMNKNGKLEILDGLHRLCRLIIEGNEKARVRKISRDLIPLVTDET